MSNSRKRCTFHSRLRNRKSRLQTIVLGSLLCGTVLLPGAAWGENITYDGSNPDMLDDPVHTFPDYPEDEGVVPDPVRSLYPHVDWSDNTVTVTGRDAILSVTEGFVFGGLAYEKAENNKVYVLNKAKTGDVYGGGGLEGANNNEVYITGVTVERVTGGRAVGVEGGAGETLNNKVFITDSRVNKIIYGGLVDQGSDTNLAGNQVTIDGANSNIRSNIYGAYSSGKGTINENSVTINDGHVEVIPSGRGLMVGGYGSPTGTKIVTNNTVTINGGNVENYNIYGARGQSSATGNATISSNAVVINGGTINVSTENDRGIYGGEHIQGNDAYVDLNSVIIKGGTVNATLGIYGGYISEGNNGTVLSNTVSVSGGEVTGNIFGGHSINIGAATENAVNLSGGTITGNIYGGDVETGTANDNSVSLSGGTITGNIFGGHSTATGTITENTVNVSGGEVTDIYGGWSSSGDVNKNTVNLYAGTVHGDMYAGFNGDERDNSVTENTMNLFGGTVEGIVYGTNLASWQTNGNNLAVANGLTNVGGVQNFQNAVIDSTGTLNVTGSAASSAHFSNLQNDNALTFYNNQHDQDVLRVEGTYSGNGRIGLDVLLGPTSIADGADTIFFDSAPSQSVNLEFKALPGSTPGVIGTPVKIATIDDGSGTESSFTSAIPRYGVYTYEITKTDNNYFLTMSDKYVGEIGHEYSQAGAAGLAQVALMSDTLLRNGFESAIVATEGRGFGISANFGYSSQRINTGSYVDIDGTSGLVSLAYHKKGKPIAFGIFGEMFDGKYETGNSVLISNNIYNMRSRGDMESYGGGISFEYRERLSEAIESGSFTAWVPGRHFEGIVRAGRSKMDFMNDDVNTAKFETSGDYYGVSFGGGYVSERSEKLAIDFYGRAVWVSMAGRNIYDSLGQNIDFERADSLRIISGLRASYKHTERFHSYTGLAVDWEVLGDSKVRVDNYEVRDASISGVSGLIELGANWKVGKSMFIDLRAVGSVGKREGFGGMMEIKYRF